MLIKLLSEPEQAVTLGLVTLLALSDNPLLWDGKKYDEITSDTDLSDLSIQLNDQEKELITDLLRSTGLDEECEEFIEPITELLVSQLKTFPLHKQELAETRMAAAQTALTQLTGKKLLGPKEALEELEELKKKLEEAMEEAMEEELEEELVEVWKKRNELQNLQIALEELIEQEEQERLEGRSVQVQIVRKEELEEHTTSRPETPKIMLFEMFLLALCDGAISPIEQELLKSFQRHYQLEDFIFDELLERAETFNAEVSKTIALVLE